MQIDEKTRNLIRSMILGGIQIEAAERNTLIEKAIEQGFYRRKTSLAIKSVDLDTHRIDFIVTTDTVDRDDERVMPRSFEKDFKLYQENPVVLGAHKHDVPAVARMVDFKFTDKDFSVTDQFAVDTTPLATELWKLYSADPPYMRAVSVGFIPVDWTFDEKDKLPGQQGRTFLENEMIEHSLVNVGSNRFALSKAYQTEKDPTLKAVLEALIEQPSAHPCGHRVLYDGDGKIVDCPLCEGELGRIADVSIADFGLRISELKNLRDSYPLQSAIRNPQSAIPQGLISQERIEVTGEKPYPNEHACRLRSPSDFEKDSFVRTKRQHEGKGYSVIMGKLKGKTTLTQQAFRYPKSDWTAKAAKSHCTDHKGILFEPASKDMEVLTQAEIKAINESDSEGVFLKEEAEKMYGRFTIPGTYERTHRDIHKAVEDYKKELIGREWHYIVIIGTTDTWVICYDEDADVFYQLDWMRDANGMVVFSNPRQIEMTIGDEAVQLSIDDVIPKAAVIIEDELIASVRNIMREINAIEPIVSPQTEGDLEQRLSTIIQTLTH